MDARCEDCRFWDASTQDGNAQPDTTGLCRINPPALAPLTAKGWWPFTSDTDWCGYFRARPEPEVEVTFQSYGPVYPKGCTCISCEIPF